MKKIAAELKLSQLKESRKVKQLRLLRLEEEIFDKSFQLSASVQAVHQKKKEHIELTNLIASIDRQMARVKESL